MRFEFAAPQKIVFGRGAAADIPAPAKEFGARALLITGRRGAPFLTEALQTAGIRVSHFSVGGEPTLDLVGRAVELARSEGCDLVIAVGGGSVLDAGKAAAAMAPHPGRILDYLEIVGAGKPLPRPGLPLIAVPTTAGTGSEATRNAVLGVPERRLKVSLRSPFLLPRLAVIDPALTDSLPPPATAYCGMDALTQLVEPLVCSAPTPITDGICREGLARAARSLAAVYNDGGNQSARDEMCAAALLSGMALANARLGAVHGFSGALGGAFEIPHGAVCARLLPFVMQANIRALEKERNAAALDRFTTAARILTGRSAAKAMDGAEWAHRLCAELKIPPLGAFGVAAERLPEIAAAAQQASSMRGNPVRFSDEELLCILKDAL